MPDDPLHDTPTAVCSAAVRHGAACRCAGSGEVPFYIGSSLHNKDSGTRPCDCEVCEGGPAVDAEELTDGLRALAEAFACNESTADRVIREAADEIERLRAENERLDLHLQAERRANHEVMWQDTLIPLAEAANIPMVGPDGNRRHFQMVDDLVAAIGRLQDAGDCLAEALHDARRRHQCDCVDGYDERVGATALAEWEAARSAKSGCLSEEANAAAPEAQHGDADHHRRTRMSR